MCISFRTVPSQPLSYDISKYVNRLCAFGCNIIILFCVRSVKMCCSGYSANSHRDIISFCFSMISNSKFVPFPCHILNVRIIMQNVRR